MMMKKYRLGLATAVTLALSVCLLIFGDAFAVSSAQRRAARAQPNTAAVYGVRAYGARGDGRTVDTPAVNRAIEAAAAAGGGTVHFPAGTYLCFSVRLKSNVALHLDAGSVILAADPAEHRSE